MSDLSNHQVVKTLRAQAWSRAKGELEAVLSTYWSETPTFDRMDDAVKEFVGLVEAEGLVD